MNLASAYVSLQSQRSFNIRHLGYGSYMMTKESESLINDHMERLSLIDKDLVFFKVDSFVSPMKVRNTRYRSIKREHPGYAKVSGLIKGAAAMHVTRFDHVYLQFYDDHVRIMISSDTDVTHVFVRHDKAGSCL